MSDQITSLEDLAAVAEGTSAVVEIVAPREPVRDELGRSYATGKRKDAVARVWINNVLDHLAGTFALICRRAHLLASFQVHGTFRRLLLH